MWGEPCRQPVESGLRAHRARSEFRARRRISCARRRSRPVAQGNRREPRHRHHLPALARRLCRGDGAPDGLLAGLAPGKVWLEMSTTDEDEVKRLAARVEAKGAAAMDCPVSGRLPPRRDRQHFDFRGRPARDFRARAAGAVDSRPPDPAHGPARLGLDAQGYDQLPVHGAPGGADRGADHDEGRGPRHEYGLRGASASRPATLSCTKPNRR